jgi:hypothetical protein
LVASTRLDFLRFRFRFEVFFVRIWLENALFLETLPDPVALNRLAAPRFVFILGMLLPPVAHVRSGSMRVLGCRKDLHAEEDRTDSKDLTPLSLISE